MMPAITTSTLPIIKTRPSTSSGDRGRALPRENALEQRHQSEVMG
jgi:hypothetical protein